MKTINVSMQDFIELDTKGYECWINAGILEYRRP
jgi:hypothetical protein